MILQKIEIEQFGGLKNYVLDLKPGAQYLYGANEAGKSTLCTFIALMFYGMPQKQRGGGLKGDHRSLYMPWGEDYMAGTLSFWAEGKDFVLKRRFGKTAKSDRCKLYLAADWQEVDIDETELGTRFLGVGAEAFYKTLYISQLGAAFSKGKEDELMARLSNLEKSGDEDASLQKAIAELEKAQFELVTQTGRGGKILQLDNQLKALQNELLEARERNQKFGGLLEEINQMTQEQEAAETLLSDLEKQRSQATLFEEFEKKRLAQKHILEQKKRLADEKTALENLEKELAILNEKKDAMASILALDEDILSPIAQKEAAMAMLAKQVEQKRSLTQEIANLEAELLQQSSNKAVFPIVFSIITVIAAILLGIFVSPLCLFFLLAPCLFFVLDKGRGAKGERALLEARLLEKKKALLVLEEEKAEDALKQLKEEVDSVFTQAQTDSFKGLSEAIGKAKVLKLDLAAKEQEKIRKEAEIKKLEDAISTEPQEDMEQVDYDGPSLLELNEKRDRLLKEQMARQTELVEKKTKAESGFSGTRSVSIIESAIKRTEQEKDELFKTYEAIKLAKETLVACGEELKQSFAPALNERSGQLIRKLTDGRYTQVRVTDDYQMNLQTEQGSEIISAEYVSAGTYDLIYFALRMAVLDTLYDRIPFLCLDDTFLQMDEKRQKAAFAMLREEPAEQILYFSCHKPTADWQEDSIINIK